jgi:putative FmdB family regulatory protein
VTRKGGAFSRKEAQLKRVPPESQDSTSRAQPDEVRLEFCLDLLTLATVLKRLIKKMPTYEYACEKCGKTFEAFQSMRDAPYKTCPKELCQQAKWGKGKVKRLLGTGAGLIFKGSGFYITDYRSNSYKEAAKKESPGGGEKGGGDSAGGKTDTKAPPAKTPGSSSKKESTS